MVGKSDTYIKFYTGENMSEIQNGLIGLLFGAGLVSLSFLIRELICNPVILFEVLFFRNISDIEDLLVGLFAWCYILLLVSSIGVGLYLLVIPI
jgi:hypothetical protein